MSGQWTLGLSDRRPKPCWEWQGHIQQSHTKRTVLFESQKRAVWLGQSKGSVLRDGGEVRWRRVLCGRPGGWRR